MESAAEKILEDVSGFCPRDNYFHISTLTGLLEDVVACLGQNLFLPGGKIKYNGREISYVTSLYLLAKVGVLGPRWYWGLPWPGYDNSKELFQNLSFIELLGGRVNETEVFKDARNRSWEDWGNVVVDVLEDVLKGEWGQALESVMSWKVGDPNYSEWEGLPGWDSDEADEEMWEDYSECGVYPLPPVPIGGQDGVLFSEDGASLQRYLQNLADVLPAVRSWERRITEYLRKHGEAFPDVGWTEAEISKRLGVVYVRVNADDVREGKPKDPKYCAIALAGQRAGLKNLRVYQHGGMEWDMGDGSRYRVGDSERVEKWIQDWERGAIVPENLGACGFEMVVEMRDFSEFCEEEEFTDERC